MDDNDDDDHIYPGAHFFCVLCGGPVLHSPHQGHEWLGEICTVYAIHETLDARLSGIAQSNSDRPFMPAYASSPPAADDAPLLEVELTPQIWLRSRASCIWNPESRAPADAWGFPFHSCCWKVLGAVRPHQPINLQALLDVCRSFINEHRMIQFGHTYGGIWRNRIFDVDFTSVDDYHFVAEPFSPDGGRIWEQMEWPNPLDISIPTMLPDSDYDSISSSTTTTTISTQFWPHNLNPNPNPNLNLNLSINIFSRLPVEIFGCIAEYLPLRSLSALQLASRACSRLPIPQSFWKSRFSLGNELDHIFDADSYIDSAANQSRSWFALFTYIQSIKNNNRAIIHRKRVWKLANQLRLLVDQAGASTCTGKPLASLIEPHLPADNTAWITASNSWSERPDPVHVSGENAFLIRQTTIPTEAVKIYVSIFEFSGQTCVTGLRFESYSGQQQQQRQQAQIGYNVSLNEHLLSPSIQLAGFLVARDKHIISGLAAISTTGMVSNWIGAYQNRRLRRLVLDSWPNHPRAIRLLKCNFDALRLYSLSISDGSDRYSDLECWLDERDRVVWDSEIPPACFSFRGLNLPRVGLNFDRTAFQYPVSMVLLGDIEGKYKQSSVQIVTTMLRAKNIISAMNVSSNSGKHQSRIGGRATLPSVKKSIVVANIDYGNGERIIGILTFYTRHHVFKGFKIRTNFQRVIDFIPDNSLDPTWRTDYCFPTDKEIIGFYTRLFPKDGFQGLGVVCI